VEKVLNFSLAFTLKNVVKNNILFSPNFQVEKAPKNVVKNEWKPQFLISNFTLFFTDKFSPILLSFFW
jgi:hypothetical protein